MSEKRDLVVFLNVQRSYPPHQDLQAFYQRDAELKPTSRDWVGLFRVGWSSSRDYYTFEWAPSAEETTKGSVTFAGRRLPPEDGHFYQLCYVTREGTVRGASPPFQFTSSAILEQLDDLELVEVADEDLNSVMVLQHKSTVEVEQLKQNCEEMRGELTSVRATLSKAEEAQETLTEKLQMMDNERATLTEKLQMMENERAALTEKLQMIDNERAALTEKLQRNEDEKVALEGVVRERDERITLLEHQLQVVKDSEQRLKEKVDRERAQNRELMAAKTDSEGQFAVLQQRIKEQQDELEATSHELHDLRQQLRIREGQVEDLEQLASARNEDVERLKEELIQAMQELGEQRALVSSLQIIVEERDVELEKMQQDLCAAQENVVELAGARNEQQQQHLAAPVNVVDQSVHEALQLAYENMEQYYLRVNSQCQNAQETIRVLEGRNAEMVARVEQCRKEFEAKASECVELQRRLKRGGGVGGGSEEEEVEALRRRVQELEVGQEEVQQSCAVAVEELTARQEECKVKEARVAELEGKLAELQREYQQLEDKYDHKIHMKNDALERQQAALDEKVEEVSALQGEKAQLEREFQLSREEKGKLEKTVQQLRRQIESMRAAGKAREDGMRACPVCNTKFPARMAQQEFERHVQGHFQD